MSDPSPDAARKRLGRAGEDAVHRYLTRAGWTVVARGFRSRFGELDLVAHEGATVVFVEVKTRTADRFGRPAEAVTWAKRARLLRVAAIWLARSGDADRPCRFDVVEVEPRGAAFRITHHRDAFRPGD
jgi:putative endonuclease